MCAPFAAAFAGVLIAAAVAAPAGAAPLSRAPARPATSPWTARTGGIPLQVRSGPARWHPKIAARRDGSPLRVACRVPGQQITGLVRATTGWNRLVDGGYVSDAYVAGDAPIPSCALLAVASAQEYAAAVAPLARRGFAEYGVPASVTLAQAMLESGLGRGDLARQGNGQFGIKCSGGPGPVAVGCRVFPTTECGAGGCYRTTGWFRVYRTLADSFVDHGRFLRGNERYAAAFRYSRQPDRFARQIHAAGYATDPAYADKLLRLMRDYDLYRYDR
jgi:hypothetical protein